MGMHLQYPETTATTGRVVLTAHDTPATEVCNGMCWIKMWCYV